MNTYPAAEPITVQTTSRGPLGWLRSAEAWLDARGRKAWIFAMVLGLIFAWPVGLALLAYITFTNRWSKEMFGMKGGCAARRNRHMMSHHGYSAAWRSSGNSTFDAYKAATLRRLEDEQEAFEAFLQRLRDAKDKSEFDSFMDERARGARDADKPATDTAVTERPGEY